MAAMIGLPVTVPEIGIAALVASLFVLSVWFEIWHRNEVRRINAYRERFKLRYERRHLDDAYLSVRQRAEHETRKAAA